MKPLFFLAIIIPLVSSGQQRQTLLLDNNWKFSLGNPANAAEVEFDDKRWETVSVPHDWAIKGPFIADGDGNTGKLPWKNEGWYRKSLDLPSGWQNGRVYLLFDGVMAFPEIYVNGVLVGKWDYGYNSFYFDITDQLKLDDQNVLAVYASTLNHDSRWYPGGGIFRKVQMIVVPNSVHVDMWGTYVVSNMINPNVAEVRIRTSIRNILNDSIKIDVNQSILAQNGEMVANVTSKVGLSAEQSKEAESSIQISNPERWDITNPALYTLVTRLERDGKLLDEYHTPFGIRTIRFTADDGFYLNDRRVQLKGVNLHHDHGPLGAAFNYRAMKRQLEIMKAMGVNAIRNSHNVAAPELLDLCDKMGLLVFNEVFDKYDAKADILQETDFEEFAHRNIRNFVVRDRNHPSVFLWSVGNEIGDVQWNINSGFHRLHTMLNYVNKYDPTRPTTLVNDSKASAKLRHFDYYDVHSWNYGRRYELARTLEPNKSVIISESASTLSSRGFYELPLPKRKTDFTKSLQVSSYDLNAPWWAEIADDDFMWQQDEPYVAGEFVWTGFDYLGEPTPYFNEGVKELGFTDKEASRSSYFGIVDLVGIPKDRYYLYKSYWKPDETTIHILPHWNWKGHEGDTVPVFVYTNGDRAELFLNGKSLGMQMKKPTSMISTERFRLMWKDVIYQPGEIKVVAYKNDEKLGERILKTTGDPYRLKLTPDRARIGADGKDLSYVLVEACDKDGNAHPLSDTEVTISLSGPGRIAGVGNGNPQSFEPFKETKKVNLFNGKAMIIIASSKIKGSIKLEVMSRGLKSDVVSIVSE